VQVPDSVCKVRKIFHFLAVFRDSACGCTKVRLGIFKVSLLVRSEAPLDI
jgi:hypothetical protein